MIILTGTTSDLIHKYPKIIKNILENFSFNFFFRMWAEIVISIVIKDGTELRKTPVLIRSHCQGMYTSKVKKRTLTMLCAMRVAFRISELAPLVTFSVPYTGGG